MGCPRPVRIKEAGIDRVRLPRLQEPGFLHRRRSRSGVGYFLRQQKEVSPEGPVRQVTGFGNYSADTLRSAIGHGEHAQPIRIGDRVDQRGGDSAADRCLDNGYLDMQEVAKRCVQCEYSVYSLSRGRTAPSLVS